MKKDKVEIIRDWFIPWIMEDTSVEDAMSHEGSIESYALGIAGSIPVNHINNWEDVKHHWDDEPCDERQRNFLTERGFDKWTDYYEDDGYVEHIPDTLEVKWVQSEEESEESEEYQETEFCVEVSGTFHVMATSEEEAEQFILDQFYGGVDSYLGELELNAGGDEDE